MLQSPVDNTPLNNPNNHPRAISLTNTAKHKNSAGVHRFKVHRSALTSEPLNPEPVNGYKMALLQIIQ